MNFLRPLPPSVWGNPAERDAELSKLPDLDRSDINETFGQIFAGIGRLSLKSFR
ncbi:MAG: hypothetical protein HQM08_28875 [Candidatus Riflebacteria bacterium]|nr:hypothetical protein [Candidatus Riflebacteria bacterium]